jgi:hypothetical protein
MIVIPMCGSGSVWASCHRRQDYRSPMQDHQAVSGGKTGQYPRGTIAARVIVPSRDGLYALQRLQEVGGFGLFWG